MNAIFQLLNPNNTVSVNRPLAHAIGLNEAIAYGALIAKYYWYSERGMLDDGWFYSTVPDLQESTALTERQQKRCIDALVKAGLLRSELRGMPAKRSFYIVEDIQLIQTLLTAGEAAMNQIKPSAAESYEKKRKSSESEAQNEPNENTRRMTDFLSAAFGGTMPTTDIPHNEANFPCSDILSEQAPQKGDSLLRQNVGASSNETAEHYFNKTKANKTKVNNPINQSSGSPATHEKTDVIDGIDAQAEREVYFSVLKENISYDYLCMENKNDKNIINELMTIMLDVVCSKKQTIRVNGEELPQELVKSVFLKLNENHIDYVLTTLHKNSSEIRNIRAYLITALYNAPSTMDSFYQAWVNHNMREKK